MKSEALLMLIYWDNDAPHLRRNPVNMLYFRLGQYNYSVFLLTVSPETVSALSLFTNSDT